MFLLETNKSLKPYNTFGISVNAKYFAEIFSEEDLIELYQSDIPKDPVLVIGGGSNILFTKDFEGLVIKMSIPGITATVDGTDVLVTAGAGVVWNDLVNYCVANNYAGIENLSLIPGTVGAAPIQNIGAYGVEIKDVFESCRALEIYSNKIVEFIPSACKFGYRDSIFKSVLKGLYIITAVSFKLTTKANINTKYGAIADELEKRRIFYPGIADVSKVVSEIRVSKLPDPTTIGNAGSFFKNPVITKTEFEPIQKNFPDIVNYPAPDGKVKLAAGWLIEQCGFKGMVSGQTGTWKNQALVLVNHGQATGQEVYSFSEQVIEAVDAKFSVKLEREVNIL